MQLQVLPTFEFKSPLFKYAANVTSQSGEDGIIAHIVDTITPENTYCVEFGAWDGKLFSNCYNLVWNRRWGGLMIEANSEKFKELEKTYTGITNVVLANRFVDFEGVNALDSILREHNAPRSFGLLSIDIDGADYHVWESLKDFRPEVVVIEMNPTVPNDVLFVQDKSFEVNQGCSLAALVVLGRDKGYELAACTPFNAIFVVADKFPSLGIAENSHYLFFRPIQDGRIFHCYDGTVHVAGFDRIFWTGARSVSSADFQVLPPEQRFWEGAVARQS